MKIEANSFDDLDSNLIFWSEIV